MRIEHYQRNTFARVLSFCSGEDKTPMDMTGATVRFVIKESESTQGGDGTSDIIHSSDHTNSETPLGGKIDLSVPSSVFSMEPGQYFYEIRLDHPTEGVQTIASEKLIIKESIITS